MNPAHFMQLCARRDEQTRQKEKGLLTEIEIDIMAPLTAHRPAADVVVVAVAGRRGSADSASTGGSISKPTGAAIIVEPQPTIRPHRASRPPPGEGLAVCCVCLEGFGEEELLRATACSHVFHGPCLETWLMRYHSRCPLCQMNLKPNAK